MAKDNNKTSAASLSDEQIRTRLQDCPIAIVGMASVFADARTLDDYWDNILDKIDSIIDVPASRWNIDDYYDPDKNAPDKTYNKRGGFIPDIDFNPMEFGLPPNILEVTDVSQLLALVVAKEVLEDAGLGEQSGYDSDKIGITLGCGVGSKLLHSLASRLQYPVLEKVLKSSGVNDADRDIILDKYKKAFVPWEENSFPGMLGNVIAGRIANRFDFGGINCTVDAACAGSLAATKLAVSELLEGRSETMITGGICLDNSPVMYMSFSKTPAFTTNETIQPFDHDSKGMMVGEGIGMVALKRLSDAEAAGDRIYAVIRGVGSSSDGKFKSIYAPRPSGQEKALRRAYEDAGFDPSTIGLIEAHGTGTAAGDLAEFTGLRQAFKETEEKNKIALGSVKSQVGHTKAAAGTAGMIKAALALHHKVLPATINVEKPAPNLEIENSPFYINSETRPWMPAADGSPRRAGVSSFGFGGTNFHFVMEEYSATQDGQYRVNRVPESIILAGANEAAVLKEAQDWLAKLSGEDASVQMQQLVKANGMRKIAANQARLGFVAKNAAEAKDALDKVVKNLTTKAGEAHWSMPSGIYYRAKGVDAKGKVVALFSGQGSQYVNMAKSATYNFPPVMNTIAAMDQLFIKDNKAPLSSLIYPIPVFNKEDAKAQEAQLQLTQHAQPSIGVMGVGLYKVMQQAGFSADFTAGHSFGELTALWAAGVLSEEDYLSLAKARGAAMAAPDDADFDAGTMVAVVGDPAKVAEDIKGFKDVSIANYNSTNQVVIAGATEQVLEAHDALKGKGYKVVKLPVSAAFHTPLVGHAQKPFAAAIDAAKFNVPKVPVYANGTGKAHSKKAADIKKVMKNHILESVRFNEEIDNLYNDGGRIFVEFGPKNVLTKLTQNILSDKDDVITVAMNDNPKKDGDTQLRQAAVQLAVAGVELDSIDPYQIERKDLSLIKKSPMNMVLNGGSYVSPKTQKAFDDALTDGHVISGQSAAPQVVEKIVEVEKVVETIVEKTVEVEKPVAAAQSAVSAPVAQAAPASQSVVVDSSAITDSIESSLAQFYQHQKDTMQVHEKYLESPKQYSDVFLGLMQQQADILNAGASEIPASVDRSMQMFHEFQGDTLKVHEQYLQAQTNSTTSALELMKAQYAALANGETVSTRPAAPVVQRADTPVATTAPAVQAAVAQPVTQSAPAPKPTAPAPKPAPQAAAPLVKPTPAPVAKVAPVAAAPAAPAFDLAKINNTMLDVVAEKTGYPAEMLELGMDMEADLGIDSIKRVEILGAVQEQIPELPELNPDDLAELRTLGQIVDYMQAQAPASSSSAAAAPSNTSAVGTAPVAAPASAGVDMAKINNTMLAVVAEKTGYPAEMLELSMDMEADLGIDSIKRVEILGAVQEQIPELPELNPDDLAELRTLGQIVAYMEEKANSMQAQAPTAAAPSNTTAVGTAPVAAPASAGVDMAKINNTMLAVVAEKTGYPAEMLELSMDMEADLGIDSIKRVEILGAVQDELPELPELNPDDLAELRTLGQIVDYMQAQAPASAPSNTTAVGTAAQAPASVGVDMAKINATMMSVVAEKTGYPAEMLELSMDMEADLGIDSIKRVEILGAVQDELPELPELNPDDLAELRTLGQIVDYMQAQAPASAPSNTTAVGTSAAPVAASAGVDMAKINATMMSVVAEKTGYPAEMLELSMDMEADLGIDSIKRVEILGAVQDELPELPELNPDDLAELRTLGQIVDYMQSKAPAAPSNTTAVGTASAAPAPSAAPAVSGDLDVATVTQVMMKVVGEKTGYPVEMLEPSMDMEADLGIDSIKRVEILGAVQDELPELPELNPDEMAELRTLGQIIDYMQSNAPAEAVVPASAASVAEVAVAAVTLEQLTPTMLAVVGEKTGYPVEMLELDMDMEADLGIDSIKRVEILGAVQDAFPEMPEINPDVLADLRTLREIVDAMSNTTGFAKGAAQAVATVTEAATSQAPSNTVAVKLLAEPDALNLDLPAASVVLLTDEGTTFTANVAKGLIAKGWSVAVLQQPKAVVAKRAKLPKEAKAFALADSTEQALEAALESVTESLGSVRAVIHLQPNLNNPAGQIAYPEASKAILLTAFLLAKHLKVSLNEAAQVGSRAAFITVPRMDGQFGYGDANDADLVQGGLCGLTKTVNLEWPEVFCRAIDIAPSIKAQQAADKVIAELYDVQANIPEVGYSAKGRITLVPEATDSYSLAAGNHISADSVFLVSGGAKGVTTKCVEQLAKQHACKFILLGRSEYNGVEPDWAKGCSDEAQLKQSAMNQLIANGDKPTPVKVQQFIKPLLSDREIGDALAAIEAAGGKAIYVAADVTDADALKAKIAPAVKQLGEITGLVHGAGVLADRYIEQKTVADFDSVYTTKIAGMQAMLACVDAAKLKHLVVFSSAAGFYGNTGQSDYSVANDILNKTALRFKQQHPSCQVLSFNWGPWDGGMVTPELKRMFAERGVYVIPIDAGAQLFANELSAADNRCPQILIGNDMSGGDAAEAEGSSVKKPLASRLQSVVTLSRVITQAANPFINDHVIGGNAVVPTVCATGWMASACETLYPDYQFVRYDNYKLFKGIIFDGTEAPEYHMDITLTAISDKADQALTCKVQIWSNNAKGLRAYHYGADITLMPRSRIAYDHTAPLYAADLSDDTIISGESLYNDGTLFHGPKFQGIDAVINHSETKLTLLCTAKTVEQEQQGQFPVGVTNAYVDDLMFQAMLVWARLYHKAGSLPSQAKQLQQFAVIEPGQSFYLSLDVVKHNASQLIADITLHDEHGAVYAHMSSGEVTISESLNKLFKK